MKFETLKQGIKKKWVISLVVLVAIIATISLVGTKANYKVTQSIPLVRGTINYTLGDVNIMAIYISGDNGYEQADNIPESGYTFNTTESYCKIGDTKQDVTINYDFATKTISVAPLTQNKMKCYLYFDVKPMTVSEILATYTIDTSRSSGSFSGVYTTNTSGTIFSGIDDYGTTYFFAGANPNNWVSFAGYYWRIIRINGDGTIRLIYNGTSTSTTGTTTQISTSAFNSTYTDNANVGYMYGSTGASTYSATHNNTNSSTIKGVLDTWYTSNLAGFASYLDGNAGFCGDRKVSTTSRNLYGTLGYGTNNTAYIPVDRVFDSNWSLLSTQTPTFKCSQTNDLYTTIGSANGNKALTNPIGLITMDEVMYAGGKGGTSNSSYWLYTGAYYWTMSPANFNSYAYVFCVYWNGDLSNHGVDNTRGVRPVINLKADTTFADGGTGTSSNPYVVQT